MKIFKKLNQAGFSHFVIPALIVVAVAGVGSYVLVATHAAVPACANAAHGSESITLCRVSYTSTASPTGTYIYGELNAFGTPKNAKPLKSTVNLNRCSKKGTNCVTIATSGTSFNNTASAPSDWETFTAIKAQSTAYSYEACTNYTDSTGWNDHFCTTFTD